MTSWRSTCAASTTLAGCPASRPWAPPPPRHAAAYWPSSIARRAAVCAAAPSTTPQSRRQVRCPGSKTSCTRTNWTSLPVSSTPQPQPAPEIPTGSATSSPCSSRAPKPWRPHSTTPPPCYTRDRPPKRSSMPPPSNQGNDETEHPLIPVKKLLTRAVDGLGGRSRDLQGLLVDCCLERHALAVS